MNLWTSGMREAVTDGVEGCVVPVCDPRAMAQALFELYNDLSLWRRMGLAGSEKVQMHFPFRTQMELFNDLFRSIERGDMNAG